MAQGVTVDPKPVQFTAVRLDRGVLHIAPVGNGHARCGRIALHPVTNEIAGRLFAAGTHRVCNSCQKVRVFVKTVVVIGDDDDITDTFTVTNKAGESLGRVTAPDARSAMRIATRNPLMDRVSKRERGLSFRRLRRSQL